MGGRLLSDMQHLGSVRAASPEPPSRPRAAHTVELCSPQAAKCQALGVAVDWVPCQHFLQRGLAGRGAFAWGR